MRRGPFVGARVLGHVGWAEGVCAVRRLSFVIERHECQVQDSWVGQVFSVVVTLLVGCSGSGKSTGTTCVGSRDGDGLVSDFRA
jgi:hypothetical protein